MVDKPGPVKPNVVRPPIIQPATPNLQQKEADQAKKLQNEKVSSQDAARLASQAGFQRLGKRRGKKGLDIGDSSQAPIPLPDDELDRESWSQEALDDAQGNLTLASAQFGEVAKGAAAGASLGATVVGSSYLPTEEDLEELEDLAHRKSRDPAPMLEEVTTNVGRLFGIELGEEVPVGHRVLAAGLVVAGEQESVHVQKGGLDEAELAGGIEKVTKRGNQAVGEAQKMNKGINKELNVHRTFVFKR